jgi:glycerol-3-phosphate acyltransferase PlsY
MLVLCLAIAYVLGSFPTGVVLSRKLTGQDIRTVGSGNIGASNMARTAGLRAGILVGLADILKGVAPVLLARWAGLSPLGLALVGVMAVVGHDYSLFLWLKGGKGVASTLGVGLALAPIPTVVAMLAWGVVMGLSGYSSVASLVALAVLPVVLAVTLQPPAFVLATVALFVLAVWKHRDNINRLWHGKERKFRTLKPANGA